MGTAALAARSSAARPASPQLSAQGSTKQVNITPWQLPSCVLPHSSALNNPPRAVVWLAGRIVCNSRARPASKFVESVSPQLSRPRDFIRKSITVSEGYLQSKDLQEFFSQFSVFRSACAESGVSFRTEGTYCCAYSERPSSIVIPNGFIVTNLLLAGSSPDSASQKGIIQLWKSSGNPVGCVD